MSLPPLGPVQPSPVTPEGFARAVGTARRRRWRQAGLAGLLVCVTASAAGQLRTGDRPLGDRLSVGPSRGRLDQPARPTRVVPPGAADRSRPRRTVSTDPGAPAPTPAQSPASPSARPGPTVDPRPAPDVLTGHADRVSAPGGCAVVADDWCGAVSVARHAASVQFTVWLCPPAGEAAGRLTFPTEQEVDVTVEGQWRWSDGQTFRAVGHTRSVRPAECLTWDVWWRHPAAGDHVVTATVTAGELAGRTFTAG